MKLKRRSMVERWKDEPINATLARAYQTNKSNAESESRAERLSKAPIHPGRVFKDPRDIARKVRSFRKDFKANETVARKLLYGRRLTRWVVDVVGTTVHVAPVRYAIYEIVSIKQMQHGETIHVYADATTGERDYRPEPSRGD